MPQATRGSASARPLRGERAGHQGFIEPHREQCVPLRGARPRPGPCVWHRVRSRHAPSSFATRRAFPSWVRTRRLPRKGRTIGSVISMKGAIVPSAVALDIGCGMVAVETQRAPTCPTGDTAGFRSPGTQQDDRGTHPHLRGRPTRSAPFSELLTRSIFTSDSTFMRATYKAVSRVGAADSLPTAHPCNRYTACRSYHLLA
jgi:tRNA-splicing ligase RtcB